jgi:hypothetical protein
MAPELHATRAYDEGCRRLLTVAGYTRSYCVLGLCPSAQGVGGSSQWRVTLRVTAFLDSVLLPSVLQAGKQNVSETGSLSVLR